MVDSELTDGGAQAPDKVTIGDRKYIAWFGEACTELRKLDPEMQLQTVMCLVYVALAGEEGILVSGLCDRVGISQSSASRNVSLLSRYKKGREPGLNLVKAEEDPYERRRKVVMLTHKGRLVMKSIADRVKGASHGKN